MLYRYMNREYANSTMEGEFRFGRLREYQLMEIVYGDISRGDRFDGFSQTLITKKFQPASNPHDRQILKAMGIHAPNATIHMENVRADNEIDCYVYCLSHRGPDNPPPIGSDCNTCVIIKDPIGFFTALSRESVELTSKRPLSEYFAGWGVCKVEYSAGIPEFERDGLVAANPCKKRMDYSDQAEERIILQPRGDLGAGFFHVSCRSASQFMEMIDIPNPTEIEKFDDAMEPYKELSLAQCDEQLDALWREYRSLENFQSEKDEARRGMESDFDAKNRAHIIRILYRRRHHDSNPNIDRKIIKGVNLHHIFSEWHYARMGHKIPGSSAGVSHLSST